MRRKWKVVSKRKKEEDEMKAEDKRLAEMMRGVRPSNRGGFHSPAKKAERGVQNRRKDRQDLRQMAREYNSEGVEE